MMIDQYPTHKERLSLKYPKLTDSTASDDGEEEDIKPKISNMHDDMMD